MQRRKWRLNIIIILTGGVFLVLVMTSPVLFSLSVTVSNLQLLLRPGVGDPNLNSSYVYEADITCQVEPLDPEYGGGMLLNHKFSLGSDNWNVFGVGNAKITIRKSMSGNNYLVAYNRSYPTDGFSQSFEINKHYLYTFSAWIQVSEGEETVLAYIVNPGGEFMASAGSVIAKSGCWSMLKGGFTAYQDIKVHLIFKCYNTKVELWIDNASLKNFTKAEWREQQERSINKIRKRDINIKVRNSQGQAVEGANIRLTQTRPLFTIGGGADKTILEYKGFQDYFTARFTAVNPYNELKWYSTETGRGQENYTVADAMVSFFTEKGIPVRGHCILWDNPNVTGAWVKSLPPRQLLDVSIRRVSSLVSRYSGKVAAWDVMNENMHNSFYESVFGANASAMFYQIVRAIDPHTPLFLNEFNTLNYPKDVTVIPSRFIRKIREIRSFPGNQGMPLHIGLQGHFTSGRPDISYIRAAFDVLSATGCPIWLTELDVRKGPTQGEDLEEVMREAFSHPAMEGLIVWSAGWKPTSCSDACLSIEDPKQLPSGCSQMCLIDNNFKILPIGEVVDKLIDEWKSNVAGVTDKHGLYSAKLFHGAYNLSCEHPSLPNPVFITFNLTKEDKDSFHLLITLK